MAGDEMAELLEPEERAHLTAHLRRLNENIERQFELIERQRQAERAADRRANRRRWAIVMVVLLLIAGGNVRVEMVRREQRQADRDQLAQILRDQCRRSNVARRETRESIGEAFDAVVAVAPPEAKAQAREAADNADANLARALPQVDCSSEPITTTFETCAAAVASGAAPLRRGDPGYSEALDGDGDGIACE